MPARARTYAALAVLLLTACIAREPARSAVIATSTSVPAVVAPTSTPAAAADHFSLTMSRGGCYRDCPSYSLTVSADGRVEYFGRSHVSVRGAHSGRVDPQALTTLRAQLQTVDFSVPLRRYRHGTAACGLWRSDAAVVTLELDDGGRRRRIEHDQGCAAAPIALTALEQTIDVETQSAQWVYGQARE